MRSLGRGASRGKDHEEQSRGKGPFLRPTSVVLALLGSGVEQGGASQHNQPPSSREGAKEQNWGPRVTELQGRAHWSLVLVLRTTNRCSPGSAAS